MDIFEEINLKGYVDEYIDPSLDLFDEIEKLKKEKNAVILAHYYQEGDIQDVADYIGDSLGLSQQAAKTDADIIVFAGVHFMANRGNVAGVTRFDVFPLVGLNLYQTRDALALVCARVVNRVALCQRTGIDAEEDQLSDERVTPQLKGERAEFAVVMV